jgi:hypothetical protein
MGRHFVTIKDNTTIGQQPSLISCVASLNLEAITHHEKHISIMGRSKPAPKRRRIEDEEAEKKAIQALKNAPPEQVEAAAAAATRSGCETWPTLSSSDDNHKIIPEWLTGLGISQTIPTHHFQALRELQQQIKSKAVTWSSWSGAEQDPRKRAFGFLPNTLGYERKTQDFLDITTPWKEENDDDEERKRNNRAMVVLKELTPGVAEAINYLCLLFSESLPDDDFHLKPYLTYKNLIAAQPNLHCGRELLPSHVDHPLKDGFGIVIITISVVGSGKIVLQDYTSTKGTTMEVAQGQAYMLAGKARDACAHAVLANPGDEERESLNLRFGLHDFKTDGIPRLGARQVLQYWDICGVEASDAKKPSKTEQVG